MATNRRAQPGLNEAPDLLVLIERARVSAVSAGSAPPGEAPPDLVPFGTVRFGLAPPGPAQSDFALSGPAQSDLGPPGPVPPAPILPGSNSSGTDGHRSRMRTRLLTAGPQSLADHEMLEMVLFLALPPPRHQAAGPRTAGPLRQLRRRHRRTGRRLMHGRRARRSRRSRAKTGPGRRPAPGARRAR
jgi:hypothetical protein